MTSPSRSEPLNADIPEACVDSSQLVETYAEGLIDDLFEDVDRLLKGDLSSYSELGLRPEWVPQPPLREDVVTVPVTLLPSLQTSSDLSDQLGEPAVSPYPSARDLAQQQLTYLALGAIGLSILTALGFWLSPSQGDSTMGTQTTEAAAPTAEEAFIDYAQRSLNRIESQATAQPASRATVATVPLAPPAVPVGNAALPADISSSSFGASPRVIERVFVPVYQPPLQMATPVPPDNGPDNGPVNGPVNDPVNDPVNGPVVNNLPLPVPSHGQVAPAPTAPAPTTPGTIPNISPNPTTVLVGILELGERSAALFEINGAPQRAYVGENIGSSGWKLESASNQELIVSRDGQERSIYVGQRF